MLARWTGKVWWKGIWFSRLLNTPKNQSKYSHGLFLSSSPHVLQYFCVCFRSLPPPHPLHTAGPYQSLAGLYYTIIPHAAETLPFFKPSSLLLTSFLANVSKTHTRTRTHFPIRVSYLTWTLILICSVFIYALSKEPKALSDTKHFRRTGSD